jgi:hypothetical protein
MFVLGILLGIAGFSFGWAANGWRKDVDIKTIQLDHAKAVKVAADDLDKANAAIQAANDQARDGIARLVAQRYEEYQRDQQEIARLNDAVRSGARRLSIAVTGCTSPSAAPGGDATAATEPAETRADIDPRAAGGLVALTQRGDEAIKDLNQCIDTYNTVRDRLKTVIAH